MSRYWSKLCCFKGGWVTLNANFRGKEASPTNDFWHQKSRVPELSYGEKIAEKFNRLSRVHQRHRQTDSQTTDGRLIAYSDREREFTFAKNRPWCKTLSKALEASNAAQCTLLPDFVKYLTVSLKVNIACLQLLCFLKPNCSSSVLRSSPNRSRGSDFICSNRTGNVSGRPRANQN